MIFKIYVDQERAAPWYYVYVDNLGVLSLVRCETRDIAEELKRLFDGSGLLLHGVELGVDTVEALGVTLDGQRLRSTLAN